MILLSSTQPFDFLEQGRYFTCGLGLYLTTSVVLPYAFILDFRLESQIGVGYQHKNVIRQRTVDSSHVGHQVVDMSVASSSLPSKGGQRRRLDKDGKEDDRCGDLDGARKSKRKKSNKSNSKTKSKKRKKEKDQYSGKINKKVPNFAVCDAK